MQTVGIDPTRLSRYVPPMKATFFVSASVVAACLLSTGCGGSSSSGNKPRNIGDEYVRGVLTQRSHAQSIVGVAAFNQAIQLFHVQHGRYPASLQELKEKGFMHQIPAPPPGKEFAYDPSSGRVTVKSR